MSGHKVVPADVGLEESAPRGSPEPVSVFPHFCAQKSLERRPTPGNDVKGAGLAPWNAWEGQDEDFRYWEPSLFFRGGRKTQAWAGLDASFSNIVYFSFLFF